LSFRIAARQRPAAVPAMNPSVRSAAQERFFRDCIDRWDNTTGSFSTMIKSASVGFCVLAFTASVALAQPSQSQGAGNAGTSGTSATTMQTDPMNANARMHKRKMKKRMMKPAMSGDNMSRDGMSGGTKKDGMGGMSK
jgi:hypothetical protein